MNFKSALAHSAKEDGSVHLLHDHLMDTANIARIFGEKCGFRNAAYLAGIWHDIGKIRPEFQVKLKTKSYNHVDHKGLGALWAWLKGWYDIALAIAGHHSGIPDCGDLRSNSIIGNGSWAEQYQELLKDLTNSNYDFLKAPPPDYGKQIDALSMEFRIRMLFSCLVDADYLDTEAHFEPDKSSLRQKPYSSLSDLSQSFFANQKSFLIERDKDIDKNSALFALRCKLYDETISKASYNPGAFSMTIPTGGGKTRAALGFALTHAAKYGKERIIAALPYTSILDQMAGEYDKIFGRENFLEHHSGWQPKEDKAVAEYLSEEKVNLISENWDAPIILTTTVQLFESLFSNKPSHCRKLHNIANSVVILDEVQTLPIRYLKPICEVIGELIKNYGVTVLFSTATQPAFDQIQAFRIAGEIRELTSDPQDAFQRLKRVKYDIKIKEKWDWRKVADEALCSPQSMTIVNTKAHSLELYKSIKESDADAIYLSTFLCPSHRKKVIKEVSIRLQENKPSHLVTTQIVEAGVDLDFPLVLRAVGPLDRIVQAAGRCNREGKLPGMGRVVVFEPEKGGMPPGEYATAAGKFISVYNSGKFIPEDPSTYHLYFSELYNIRGEDGLDSKGISKLRNKLEFKQVDESFKMIEDGYTESVAVGYKSEKKEHKWENSPAAKIFLELQKDDSKENRRTLFRRLQAFMVEINKNKIPSLEKRGLIQFDKSLQIYYYIGEYDDKIGIGELNHENSIFNQ